MYRVYLAGTVADMPSGQQAPFFAAPMAESFSYRREVRRAAAAERFWRRAKRGRERGKKVESRSKYVTTNGGGQHILKVSLPKGW